MKEVRVTIGGNTKVLNIAKEKRNVLQNQLSNVEAEITKYDKIFHSCPNKETWRDFADAKSKKKRIEQQIEGLELVIRINSQKETFTFCLD